MLVVIATVPGKPEKRAEILESLRAVDADKALDAQRQLLKRMPMTKAAGP